MKTSEIYSNRSHGVPTCHAAKGCVAAVLAVLIGMSWDMAIGQSQPPDNDAPGTQVLTRGPVHEAFAGMVTFNPAPGIVVTKAPPAIIEEMPPEERPVGDNVAWIPGYWGWDDERSDFLWVSGTWRALPPGRAWMAGYWGQTPQGYQWTSGYWADAAVQQTTYLPPPPATVEVGPNIAAPSIDYGWSPGCWIWYQGRYAWRPGYWAQGRADWDWCPAHYVWSPRGYIFVGGFWDYPVARRGVLFAPVYFEAGVYARRGYIYSPRIVIGLGVFSDHLFLRPTYGHYYFGDYYAASYVQGGFYASFSFQSGHRGYDPIYSHQRWEHRQDREWEHHAATSYEYRRDHETARPPRTWAAQTTINQTTINQSTVNQTTINQTTINRGTPQPQQTRMVIATPIDQLAKRKDSPMRFQPVAKEERQQLARRGQEVQKSREQRRTLEAKSVSPTTQQPGGRFEPAKAQLPRSPIVAKSANQLGRNKAPPKAQQAPKPDLKVQPKSETSGRQPNMDRPSPGRSVQQGDAGELRPGEGRGNSQPQPRKPESEKKATPAHSEAAPRERQVQPQAQSQVQPRAPESVARVPAIPQRNVSGLESQAQPGAEPQGKTVAVKTAEPPQRNVRALETKAQPQPQTRAPASAGQAQKELQRNAIGLEQKAQPELQPRAKAPAENARVAAQRNVNGSEQKTQRVSAQPAKRRPYQIEKGATQLIKKDRKQEATKHEQ